jgi:thioredoxin reductase (NADPH)
MDGMGKNFDVMIIGSGPGGLTAGFYLARARVQTLLVERLGIGGQAVLTEKIENFPGFPKGISGRELMMRIEAQADKFGLDIMPNTEVLEITKDNSNKITLKTTNGNFKCTALIVASGVSQKKLGVPGEEELTGRGVSYCSTCDGPRFKNEEVLVAGGGDMAVQEALFLTTLCKKVTIVHRGNQLRATKILQERASSAKNLSFIWHSEVKKIWGSSTVTGVEIGNKLTGKLSNICCRGVFIFIGSRPNTEILKKLVHLDEDGYVLTDENMQTSQEGIFACGDVRKKLLRQIITACGEGATAAAAAESYIINASNDGS